MTRIHRGDGVGAGRNPDGLSRRLDLGGRLATLAAIGLYAEWLSIVGMAGRWQATAAGIGALILMGWWLGQAHFEALLITLALGLVIVGALAPERRIWAAAGFFYAAAAQIAAILTRMDPGLGLSALILILLVVWVTDIGGYVAGRSIGGPKLWPRISPQQDLGRCDRRLCSESSGRRRVRPPSNMPKLHRFSCSGAVLSIAAQFGDLFEVRDKTSVRGKGFRTHHPWPWWAPGPA